MNKKKKRAYEKKQDSMVPQTKEVLHKSFIRAQGGYLLWRGQAICYGKERRREREEGEEKEEKQNYSGNINT